MNNSFILGCHIDVSFFRAGLCLPSVFFLFRGTENLPEYVGEHSSSPKARICSNNIIIVFTFYINKKNTNYILHLSCGTRHETCFIADSTNENPQTQPLIGGGSHPANLRTVKRAGRTGKPFFSPFRHFRPVWCSRVAGCGRKSVTTA